MAESAAKSRARQAWDLEVGASGIPIWLDCDTGHDDAFAILLAAHCPRLELLGVSTVHGNSSLANTTRNTLSILKAIGKRDIDVYPGAAKPFCREASHAPDIHGASGLDGTTILPTPTKGPDTSNGAVDAMYQALSHTAPQTAWLVSTGTLTNIALLFAIHPQLANHIAGLSIMGGAIGGLFTHAPLGRLTEHSTRLSLSDRLSRELPHGFSDQSDQNVDDVARELRRLGLIIDADAIGVEQLSTLLENARRSFGNTTPYAEFNIYCDPEAAASIFLNSTLAAKTTLIPLDITHQVLGNKDVQYILSGNYSGPDDRLASSAVRHLFLEILRYFAHTYEREFGMSDGPPLHDPIAVAAAFAPQMFDDQDGERYGVYIVGAGDDGTADAQRKTNEGGSQRGRTIAKMLSRGEPGVRIPRTLNVSEFWEMINLALIEADRSSILTF